MAYPQGKSNIFTDFAVHCTGALPYLVQQGGRAGPTGTVWVIFLYLPTGLHSKWNVRSCSIINVLCDHLMNVLICV